MKLSYRWQATIVIALGLFMAVLDTTIVSVVLPQMAKAFNTDYQTITWVATGYLLANAAVVPIIGYLSDRVGSKMVFVTALGLFTLGSGLCAIAPNQQLLIAFRALQGIGGGAMLPVAMTIIFRMFGPTERAGAMVLLMVPLLLGPAFGPTLGGYLATNFTWNAIFTINLPIGIVTFVLSVLTLRGNVAEREANGSEGVETQGFDLPGLLLAMAGFTAFVYGITSAGSDGWGDTMVISFLIAGGVMLIMFVLVELRVKDPVMDLRLFRNYTFIVSNILIWAVTAVLFGSLFLLPLFFEKVEGLSALSTGEIVIVQGLTMAVGLALSGKLYNSVGPRLLTVVGLAITAVSMIGFTRLETTTTGMDVQIWLVLRGFGLGLAAQPLQTLAVSAVSNRQMAKATSLINSTKTAFGAIGVSILTTYLSHQSTNYAQTIVSDLKARPVSGVAATCIRQAGPHTQVLKACVGQHALTMAMNDTFVLVLICCVVCTLLALFLGRDPALEAAKEAKKRGEVVEDTRAAVIGG